MLGSQLPWSSGWRELNVGFKITMEFWMEGVQCQVHSYHGVLGKVAVFVLQVACVLMTSSDFRVFDEEQFSVVTDPLEHLKDTGNV